MNGSQYLKALVARHSKVAKKPEEKPEEKPAEPKKAAKKTKRSK